MNDTNEACETILVLLQYVDRDRSVDTGLNHSYPSENNSIIIAGDPLLESIKLYLETIVNPVLCMFGIIGNLFNIFVLTRKRFQTALDRSHEKVAVIGLIALAVSDSLYCISTLPGALVGRPKTLIRDLDALFMYQVYGVGVKDYFIHTSNWLIVLMAVSRYMAICRPLHSRGLISAKVTILSIMCVFTIWIPLTLPNFWTYDIVHVHCEDVNDSLTVHILDQGYFVKSKSMKLSFSYIWTLLGFFLPVILLIYCNYHLVKSVRESMQMQTLYRVHSRSSRKSNNITPTLVAVIFMFIGCTSPSEILHFYYYSIGENYAEQISTVIVFTNVLLSLNYSMNFLLYCIVNSRFRDTLTHILRCGPLRIVRRQRSMTTATGSCGRAPSKTDNTTNLYSQVAEGSNHPLIRNGIQQVDIASDDSIKVKNYLATDVTAVGKECVEVGKITAFQP